MSEENTTSFLLSAANVSWGRRERSCIETVADVAGSLGGKYFHLSAIDSSLAEKLYYVWLDTGSSTDPAPSGRTGIQVVITSGDDEATVASLIQVAIEAETDLRAKIASNDTGAVLVDSELVGKVTASADVDSGFTISQTKSGLGGDLGKTQGGVELSMETSTTEITSDQTGSVPLDEVITGYKVEVTVSLLEMTAERWETVVGSVTGNTFTPAGGTQLVGFGTKRLYQSLLELGGELLLHPTRKDASDKSFDITIFKSAPKPTSINFSGEDAQVMEVTFTALVDAEVRNEINIFAFGNSSQDVRA